MTRYWSGGIALIAMVAWLLAWHHNAAAALGAYLVAYVAVVMVVLGALLQVMISYLTNARWFAVLRRFTLPVLGTMPVLALMAIPLALGRGQLYPATLHPSIVRSGWFTPAFVDARGLVCVASWLLFAGVLRAGALRLDTLGPVEIAAATRRLRRCSAAGCVVVAITLTLAGFDWIMALEPSWYSTIYGVYLFSGAILAALGLIALIAAVQARRRAALRPFVTAGQRAALATLILTFAIFWGYIAFSQFLIIWIADLPAESAWYVARASGNWRVLGFAVLIGQTAVPVLVFLSRRRKTAIGISGWLGAWLLLMHLLDCAWLVLPALDGARRPTGWVGLAAIVAVAGWTIAAGNWLGERQRWLPIGDPDLDRAIAPLSDPTGLLSGDAWPG